MLLPNPMYRALALAGLLFASSVCARSDVVSWDLERREWSSQVGSTPLVGAYQFATTATGLGLAESTLATPVTTHPLAGTSVQRSWSTNLALGSALPSGSALSTAFEQAFPAGVYRLQALVQATNPITGRVTTRTNALSVVWTNGFPAGVPVITNLAPPEPLAATQTFAWPGFGSAPDYASLYVMEGQFDTNLIAGLLQQGVAALTNLAVRHASPRLDPGPGSVTVTNLNPALDHLVWLEFHRPNPETHQALGEVDSVRANLMFHRREAAPVIVVPPASSTAPAGSTVTLEVVATGGPLTFRWWHDGVLLPQATEATLVLANLGPAQLGTYEVEVANAAGTARSAPAVIGFEESTPTPTRPPGIGIAREDSQLRLRVTGSPNTRFVVERSEDLESWAEHAPVTTDAAGVADLRVVAVNRQRAFRVVLR